MYSGGGYKNFFRTPPQIIYPVKKYAKDKLIWKNLQCWVAIDCKTASTINFHKTTIILIDLIYIFIYLHKYTKYQNYLKKWLLTSMYIIIVTKYED